MDKNAPQGSEDDGKIDWQRAVAIGRHFRVKRLVTPADRLARNAAGKRSLTRTERKRGRYVRARQMVGPPDDVAFDATLRAAAPFQRERHGEKVQAGETPEEGRRPALLVRRQDLHQKIRVRRASNLILFVVDASWSMSAAERIEATKGAVLSLLQDAYQRRDHVGMIVFQGTEATVVLRPTSSVGLAQRALKDIAAGGKTPLSAGLWAAYQVCIAARRRDPEVVPLIIILTDGAGNISMGWLPPQEEAWHVADLIRQAHLRSIVVNMEHPAHDQGLPERLAQSLGGPCRNLTQLGADARLRIVRDDQARAGSLLTG
jgi:magnesium chelatase subunit D